MRTDLILENGDLKIDGNDFVVSVSDQQNVELCIYSEKGWFKLSPFFGCAINSRLNSKTDVNAITRLIKGEVLTDGYSNVNVLVQGDKISVSI
mgnify:CR=1 FL=1